MTASYRTIGRDAAAELEVRRSRFLCTTRRVEDESAAREVLAALRKAHGDAGHHCSAFVLGADRALERSSDDGEPAGTAGTPMLEVLRGREVSDVVVVVTRWFGGTLLGSGGLVRAYADAVRAGLAAAGTRQRVLMRELAVELSHSEAGRVESEVRHRGVVVLDATYAAGVTLTLGVHVGGEEQLAGLLGDLTGGSAVPQQTGERWVDGPILET